MEQPIQRYALLFDHLAQPIWAGPTKLNIEGQSIWVEGIGPNKLQVPSHHVTQLGAYGGMFFQDGRQLQLFYSLDEAKEYLHQHQHSWQISKQRMNEQLQMILSWN